MLPARRDIIGDLARLRHRFTESANSADKQLTELETLAAAAVELGTSDNIVGKASGIPKQRIDAVLDAQQLSVHGQTGAYHRLDPGAVTLRKH